MDTALYELHNSPIYQDVLRVLGIAALLGALAFAGVAVSAGPPRWRTGERRTDWDMLFECWRDSFAITLLYVAYDLIGSFEVYLGQASFGGGTAGLRAAILTPYLRLILVVAIGVIGLRRILELGRWLKARRDAAARQAGEGAAPDADL